MIKKISQKHNSETRSNAIAFNLHANSKLTKSSQEKILIGISKNPGPSLSKNSLLLFNQASPSSHPHSTPPHSPSLKLSNSLNSFKYRVNIGSKSIFSRNWKTKNIRSFFSFTHHLLSLITRSSLKAYSLINN